MTLAEELAGTPKPQPARGRFIDLSWQRFRLPFDGSLSPDEQRMADEGAYNYGPCEWEPS